MFSSSDRRKHTRVLPRRNEPIAVQLMGDGFIEMLSAKDISVGGLAVSIGHEVDAAALTSEVHVIVCLPGIKAFSAWGTVRYISAARKMFGVQFTKLKPENQLAIESYVKARVAEGGTAPEFNAQGAVA